MKLQVYPPMIDSGGKLKKKMVYRFILDKAGVKVLGVRRDPLRYVVLGDEDGVKSLESLVTEIISLELPSLKWKLMWVDNIKDVSDYSPIATMRVQYRLRKYNQNRFPVTFHENKYLVALKLDDYLIYRVSRA